MPDDGEQIPTADLQLGGGRRGLAGGDGGIAIRSSGGDACCINQVAWNKGDNCARVLANEKLLNAAHQFGACILDAPIVRLCIVVGDDISCTHCPEVLFCVKHSLLQFVSLFILRVQPLCAPLAEIRKCRWLAIHIQIRLKNITSGRK